MEKDSIKQIQFGDYIFLVNHITNCIIIIVLDIDHSTYLYCYMQSQKFYKDLILEISKQLNSMYGKEHTYKIDEIETMFNGDLLSNIININNDVIQQYPLTSIKKPIIISKYVQINKVNLIEDQIIELYVMPILHVIDKTSNDVQWSLKVNACIWRIILVNIK